MYADQINSLRNFSIKSRLIADGLKYAQIEIWAECLLRFPATPRGFAASCDTYVGRDKRPKDGLNYVSISMTPPHNCPQT